MPHFFDDDLSELGVTRELTGMSLDGVIKDDFGYQAVLSATYTKSYFPRLWQDDVDRKSEAVFAHVLIDETGAVSW